MTTECSVLLGMGVGSTGHRGNSRTGHTLPVLGVREGFLEVTVPALRPEGGQPAAKPGLEGSRYGRLALEGC